MAARKHKDVERDYVESVGFEPRNLPDDHPDKWQWEYRGTKDEREELLDRLAGNDPADEGSPQEESLF